MRRLAAGLISLGALLFYDKIYAESIPAREEPRITQEINNLRVENMRIIFTHTKHYRLDDLPRVLNTFTPSQRLRIYTGLASLKQERFLDDLGNALNEDFHDEYSEHGGRFDFTLTGLKFRKIDSVYTKEQDFMNNRTYLPEENMDDAFATSHFHAVLGYFREYNFPSTANITRREISKNVFEERISGDIFGSRNVASEKGESHSYLLVRLPEDHKSKKTAKFKLVYYSSTLNPRNKEISTIVIDLGDYPILPST